MELTVFEGAEATARHVAYLRQRNWLDYGCRHGDVGVTLFVSAFTLDTGWCDACWKDSFAPHRCFGCGQAREAEWGAGRNPVMRHLSEDQGVTVVVFTLCAACNIWEHS